jgi:hypothetical protein
LPQHKYLLKNVLVQIANKMGLQKNADILILQVRKSFFTDGVCICRAVVEAIFLLFICFCVLDVKFSFVIICEVNCVVIVSVLDILFLNCVFMIMDHLCGLVVRVCGYRSRGQVRFLPLPGLERGPFSLVSTIEELLKRKSSGSGLEIREYGRRDPSR